ncbi:MAG: rRNA pseudouridine synthase [Opitutales bacterium]|nr:rRNA pseudouridine synthase [Opitutales bacterium]
MDSKSEEVRIHKYIAEMGICSRRAAEQLIEEGAVTVDGQPAQIGQKVNPELQRIVVNGRTLKPSQRPATVTLLMNKPRGVLCTNDDPFGGRTVFDILPPVYQSMRLFCAGRLDKDSEGMLVMTSDGELAQQLMHPSRRVIKRYRVLLTKPFDPKHIRVLLSGVEVEGERLSAEKIIMMKRSAAPERDLEIHLQHGRKREIRRMMEFLGYYVERLARFQIGRLVLRGIGPGKVKQLSKSEIEMMLK